jgi:hypothetical protein
MLDLIDRGNVVDGEGGKFVRRDEKSGLAGAPGHRALDERLFAVRTPDSPVRVE